VTSIRQLGIFVAQFQHILAKQMPVTRELTTPSTGLWFGIPKLLAKIGPVCRR